MADDAPIKTKVWERHTPAFNQGNIGDCTGNAEVGVLMTDPFYLPTRTLSESDAVDLYSLATHIDPIDGQSYPPDDTGSSGLDVCKAAVQKGYITGYHHGFVVQTVQQYLSNNGPVILGMNWYSSFDTPDNNGMVKITPNAEVRGGHEVEISEIDVTQMVYGIWNSWGPSWGDNGKFYMPWEVLERLLNEEGDITASVTATTQ